ncbi:MAG TPA: insulinase family protein, partial [Sphingomicrobium sp.]|nr:insulinase family protein [Sphingomicrobium sp.]
DDARAYYSSHYAPGNSVLAIVGDFNLAQARMLLSRDFADVPARPVAQPNATTEPPQSGQRRIQLTGPVDRQYFLVTFPSPAASNRDFAAFMVLQQILSGGSGLNLHQSDWSATPSSAGSSLFGIASDIASFLPPTRDPFLFTISGSIARGANREVLERDLERRISEYANRPISEPRLAEARRAVIRALAEDVQTTADAAHQLAFFEGIGALDVLLSMPQRIERVTSADVQRVAQTYLRTDSSTVGWMVPGTAPVSRPGQGRPQQAADRPGTPSTASTPAGSELRRLSSGLPAIVQTNPLSNTATVELILTGQVRGGTHPSELPGLDAVVRSGTPDDLEALVSQSIAAGRRQQVRGDLPSEDPATRLQQLIFKQIGPHASIAPKPLAVIVSGKVEPDRAFAILERALAAEPPARLAGDTSPPAGQSTLRLVRERIGKPLAQGALGYVVEGPPRGTREALAWQLLLYVLTHDYSGRLGRSAITDKGIVYHIHSDTSIADGRTWATISTGVDPDKADLMEAELRSQLARLATQPPTPSELDAARNHLLGRDLTAAQSNEQFTAKLARDLIETGGLRSHDSLRAELARITPADLLAASHAFATGTIIRVDVINRTGGTAEVLADRLLQANRTSKLDAFPQQADSIIGTR